MDGINEKAIIISSNKKHTIEQFKFIRDSFPKDNMAYELREYKNHLTNKYTVLNI